MVGRSKRLLQAWRVLRGDEQLSETTERSIEASVAGKLRVQELASKVGWAEAHEIYQLGIRTGELRERSWFQDFIDRSNR